MRRLLALAALLLGLLVWAFLAERAPRQSRPAREASSTPELPSATPAPPDGAAELGQREEDAPAAEVAHSASVDAPSGASVPLQVLEGRVRDDQGDPVTEYEIRAERVGGASPEAVPVSASVRERRGLFRLEGLATGKWKVLFQAEGLAGRALELHVPRADPLEVQLSRRVRVRGLVSGPDGLACGAVDVHCDREEFEEGSSYPGRRVLHTGPDGAFECELPPGALVLHARAAGFAPSQNLVLELAPGEEREDLELRLRVGGTIVGEVLDFGGQGVGAAEVTLRAPSDAAPAEAYEQTIRAGADGRFEFHEVPQGEFELTSTFEGLDLRAWTSLDAGGVAFVRLAPEQRTYTRVRGRVTFAGQPHAHVQLVLERGESAQGKGSAARVAATECDAEGDYVLRVPGGESYWLQIVSWEPELLTARVTLGVPPAHEHVVDIDLATGRVRGTVRSSAGEALFGAEVELLPAQDPGAHRTSVTTGPDGSFELEAVAGELVLRARGPRERVSDFVPLERTDLRLARGQVLEGLELVLPVAGSLVGVVRFEDGSRAAGAELHLVRDGQSLPLGWSARDGSFVAGQIEAGEYLLGATLGHHATRNNVPVVVAEGEATPVELSLRACVPCVVRVASPTKAPLHVTWIDELEEQHTLQVVSGQDLAIGNLFVGTHTFSAKIEGLSVEVIQIVTGSEAELTVELRFP